MQFQIDVLPFQISCSDQRRRSLVEMGFKRKDGRFVSKKKKEHLSAIEQVRRSENLQVLPGRRIVDVDVIASAMKCESCGQGLSLDMITDEQRHGLGSFFHFTCQCKHITKIATGKTHKHLSKGPAIFDINTKAATAMVHVGLGPSHVAEAFSVMNIPPPTIRTLKKREREIGPLIEKTAKKSCVNAVNKVIEQNNDSTINALTASYDMGWQRRSAGRSYNSMSGHGSLIEKESGKLLAYGCRITNCKICDIAAKTNEEPKPHDCRKNWGGSSKAMEQSVAVELVQEVRCDAAAVKTIVMDDDSTTLSHLRKEYDPEIIKWSDTNHAKKAFTSMLYKLSNKFRILTSNKNKIINYMGKCFSYAIAQCDKQSDILSRNLRAIPRHMFGDHSECGRWCGATHNAEYKFSSLPYGKPLEDVNLKEELVNIFDIFALNADRLAPGGSTKVNESFNNIVASKAPKSRHYSSSESFSFRLGAAAAQKNEGKSYVSDVFQEHALSPSLTHQKRVAAQETVAASRAATESTKTFKNRKNHLKDQRSKNKSNQHQKEGATYQRYIGLSEGESLGKELNSPKFIPKPPLEKISADACDVIYLDLETSGATSDEPTSLCQISMLSPIKGNFNAYVCPDNQITPYVQKLTGLTLNEKTLCYMGRPLLTKTLPEAMDDCLQFIESHEGSVALVAHNARVCDAPLLTQAMAAVGFIDRFSKCVSGFIDSLPLFKTLYPNKKNFSQEVLCEELLGMVYSAHNAADDCCALKSLMEYVLGEHEVTLGDFSTSVASMNVSNAWNAARKERLGSYSHAKSVSAISGGMASRCAGSGLRMEDVARVYCAGGKAGVQELLSEKYDGVVRVTGSSMVIKKLCDYLHLHTNTRQC